MYFLQEIVGLISSPMPGTGQWPPVIFWRRFRLTAQSLHAIFAATLTGSNFQEPSQERNRTMMNVFSNLLDYLRSRHP